MRKHLLPNVAITVDIDFVTDLMVIGGRQPSCSWLRQLSSCEQVWAVDKGINQCMKAGLNVDSYIGDGDSSDSTYREQAKKNGALIYRYPVEKNDTDFQLALKQYEDFKNVQNSCIPHKLLITGTFGGRFDHLWSVIVSALNGYYGSQPFAMADDNEHIIFIGNGNGNESIKEVKIKFDRKPKAFSLIPFSEQCTGVTAQGVKWELNNAELYFGKPYSISNEIIDDTVTVSIGNGTLGIYWIWQE